MYADNAGCRPHQPGASPWLIGNASPGTLQLCLQCSRRGCCKFAVADIPADALRGFGVVLALFLRRGGVGAASGLCGVFAGIALANCYIPSLSFRVGLRVLLKSDIICNFKGHDLCLCVFLFWSLGFLGWVGSLVFDLQGCMDTA